MNKYKLLAVDIDGTLCMPGKEISIGVVESLRKCVNSNILVVLSTGKKFASLLTLCEDIGIEGPVITCNGAITMRIKTQEILFSFFLPKTLYYKIISTLENNGKTNIAVFTGYDIVCTDINLASKLLSFIGESTTRFENSLPALSSENVVKILIAFGNIEKLRSAYNFYSHRFAKYCYITITSDNFLEFMPLNVSKGKALLDIAESNRIARQNIACISDSDNDLSMFEVAGLSIAVANASPAVLQTADVVVPAVSSCGVTEAINNLILGQKIGDEDWKLE